MSASDDIATLLDSTKTMKDKLEVVEQLTTQRLSRLLGLEAGKKIPDQFADIVTNVTAARYARIGNWGQSSYSQDGLSIAFPDDDFGPYMAEINAFKDGDDYYHPRKGGFEFI